MKTPFLPLALFLATALPLSAQKGVEDGSQYGKGADSVRCVENLSLFVPYAKSGNYKDAAEFWEIVYNECPAASRNIYIYGPQIVRYQLENETDPAKRQALVDKLLGIYDTRVKYFGDDPRYPTPWIIGNKALDYADLMREKADKNLLFGWYKESIAGLKETVNPLILWNYMQLVDEFYKAGKLTKEDYVNAYVENAANIDGYIASAKPDMLEFANQVKSGISALFAQSGTADCATLEAIYAPQVEAGKGDLEFLKQTIRLLRKLRCEDSDVYLTASNYAHQIQPTAESAAGMAKQALKKDDIDGAIGFFEEAARLADEPSDKADFLFNIAVIYTTQKRNYPKAREYARKALAQNPNLGQAYILIAKLYASDAYNIYPNDNVMAQTVFYSVLDKLAKAKEVDPSLTDEVNSLMANYRGHLPRQDDIFMHADLKKGQTITIGGWIQENVVIR